MLDSLFGRGSASKCKSLIKPIKCRVDFLRKKRTSKVNMLRKDVAELLAKGQDQSAFSRAVTINSIKCHDIESIVSICNDEVKELIQKVSSKLKVGGFPLQFRNPEAMRNPVKTYSISDSTVMDCPQDIKEAVSSLIFAAARCADLPELQGLRSIFATRYGDDFANAAIELLPDCGVNQQIIEKLLARPPSSDVKLKLMKEIAEQTDCRWESSNLEAKIHSLPENSPDGAQDLRSFKSFQNRTDSSHHLPSHKPFVDSSLHSTSSSAVKKKEAAISYEMKESVLRPVGCEEDIYNRDIPVVSSSVKEIPIIPGDSDKRVEKLNSLPGSRSKYLKNSSSDPFVQANLKFTDMEASADRATADQADEAKYLAADHEKSLNKLQTKTEVVNCQFDTRPESQEEDPRQSNDKPWTSKISRGTSAAEIKDHEIKYSNGNANTLFLEESNGIPWRDSVPAAQHMSDMAYRMSTRRASHLTVDKEEFGEFSERADNRKFQEHYDNRRQRSSRTCDEVSKLEANGVQADSHGKHYRPPRTYRQDVEDHEPRRFNRPDGRGDATAEKECESEFQDSSTNGRKFKAKSKRFHSGSSHYAVEKNNFYFADNAGKFIAANRVDQNVFEPSIKESTGRKLYSDQVLESEEGDSSPTNNLNPNDDHGSDLEEQNLQQSYHTKRCTNLTYLQTAESVRRGQTRETKLQQESNNSVDSPHTHIYHVDQNNSDLEDHYFQECVSKGLRAKGTPLAGAKFERKQSDSRLTGESKSLSRRINSLQHKEGYPLNKEQLASSLDVQGEKFSWKNRRDERVLSESKQKVYTSMDSQVGIVEAGNVQHSDHHQFLNGKHRIPEATECSPAEGRRHNIQHAKSYRGRDVENASHQVQSHDPSECLHSTSVKKLSKSRMPPSIEVVRKNSYTLPSDSTINSPLPPPSRPPISPTPAQASVSPECISQAGHYYKQAMPATGSSPQRLSPEHHRAVSLPPERSTKREKSPQFSKSSSDVGPSHTPHVHPKLPDYDDLAARFQALRQQRTTK